MGIDWLRDLVICILGLVAIGVLIFMAVLMYSLYRRVRPILDSVKANSETIKAISSIVEEIVKPLIQLAALIRGVRQGKDAINKIFQKKEDGKDG